MATVAGLFTNPEEVNKTLVELNHLGYTQGSISIAAPESSDTNLIMGEFTLVPPRESNQTEGILVTVVTEDDRHPIVEQLMKQSGAVNVDTRYGIWHHGGIDEYEDVTNELREDRSKE